MTARSPVSLQSLRGTPPGRAGAGAQADVASKLALPVRLYLWCILLPIGFYAGPLYLNFIRIILLATMIPAATRLLSGKCGRILATDICFILFILWVAIATSINDPSRFMEHVGSTTIEFLGSYLLARAYIRTHRDFMQMAQLLILVILLTLPLALVELFTNRPPILEILQKIPGIRTEYIVEGPDERRMNLFRVQAVFPHPIHYGIFCSIGFSLCFVAMKGVFSPMRRYVSTALVGFLTFTSLSSGAMLPLMMQGGFIAYARVLQKVKARWLILICMIAAAYLFLEIFAKRAPLIVFISYATFSPWNAWIRIAQFQYAMQNVHDNAWFGLGLVRPMVAPAWVMAVDNFWLVEALRYGYPGISLLLSGFLLPIVPIGIKRFAADGPVWPIRRAWMFLFIGLIFSMTTVHLWTTILSFVAFIFGAGMWLQTIPADPKDKTAKAGATPVRAQTARRSPVEPDVALSQSVEDEPEQPPVRGPVYSRFPHKSRSS